MVTTANHQLPWSLLLEMAANAQIMISLGQHFCVHRAVGIVAGRAALPDGFMFEDERAALGQVTFAAGFLFRGEPGSSMDGVALVRIVAVAATDFPLDDRMMGGELKFASLVQVTLKAGFRTPARIDDRVAGAAAFGVDAARPVARLAPDLGRVRSFGFQTRMGGGMKVSGDVFVTLRAVLRSNECRPGNLRWSDHHPI
jgi:hypothetical protein